MKRIGFCVSFYISMCVTLDRDAKKSKFSEWPAEFIVHSRDNSKNFLLKKFSKILQKAHAHQQLK